MKSNWHFAPALALLALAGCGDGAYEKSGKEADRANNTIVSGDEGPGARAGRAIDNALEADKREIDATLDAAKDRADAIKEKGEKVADRLEDKADLVREQTRDEAKQIKDRVAEIER